MGSWIFGSLLLFSLFLLTRFNLCIFSGVFFMDFVNTCENGNKDPHSKNQFIVHSTFNVCTVYVCVCPIKFYWNSNFLFIYIWNGIHRSVMQMPAIYRTQSCRRFHQFRLVRWCIYPVLSIVCALFYGRFSRFRCLFGMGIFHWGLLFCPSFTLFS